MCRRNSVGSTCGLVHSAVPFYNWDSSILVLGFLKVISSVGDGMNLKQFSILQCSWISDWSGPFRDPPTVSSGFVSPTCGLVDPFVLFTVLKFFPLPTNEEIWNYTIEGTKPHVDRSDFKPTNDSEMTLRKPNAHPKWSCRVWSQCEYSFSSTLSSFTFCGILIITSISSLFLFNASIPSIIALTFLHVRLTTQLPHLPSIAKDLSSSKFRIIIYLV